MADWSFYTNDTERGKVELVSPGKEGEYCVKFSVYSPSGVGSVYAYLERLNFLCKEFTIITWYKGDGGRVWHKSYAVDDYEEIYGFGLPSSSDWVKVKVVCYYDESLDMRIREIYTYNEETGEWEEWEKKSVGTGAPAEKSLAIGAFVPTNEGLKVAYYDNTYCYVPS